MGIYVTHKTQTNVSYDIQVFGKVALVLKLTETKVNGRKAPDTSETFFIERRIVEPTTPTASKIEKARKLMYFTPENLALLWDELAKNKDWMATLTRVTEETGEIKSFAGLDQHNFYYLNDYDHSFWRAGEDTPTSTPLYIDDIVGVTSDRYDLDAAQKVLENNPRVTNLERVECRNYDGGDYAPVVEALVFAFEFSQKHLNMLYKENPKCHPGWLKETLKGWDLDNFNFLKLKRARRKDT